LIAGGTGFVGSQAVKVFEKLGYDTMVISRKAPVLPGRKIRTWKELEADGLPAGTVAVINCSGQSIVDPSNRWTEKFKQELYDSRMETTTSLAKAITSAPEKPACFVNVTGNLFYPMDSEAGEGHQGWAEDSPGGTHNWIARMVADWEAAAKLPASVDTRVVNLRAGLILGRTGGLVYELFPRFSKGLGGRMGPGNQVMPWIHVKDVTGLMVHCVTNKDCVGVYNTVAPEVITNNDFVKTFAGELKKPAMLPTPEFVLRMVFGQERASMICGSQTVLPRRTLNSGYKFAFPTIKEACQEMAPLNYVDQ